MSDPFSGRNRPAIPELNCNGLSTFLRRRHHFDTAERVAGETGIAAETVRNWLKHRNEMRAAHLLRLVEVYGVDLLAAVWPSQPPDWLTAGQRAATLTALKAEQARIDAAIARLGAGDP